MAGIAFRERDPIWQRELLSIQERKLTVFFKKAGVGVFAFVLCGLGSVVNAESRSYYCEFGMDRPPANNRGASVEQLLVSIDIQKGTARVFNGAVEHAHGKPITVKIKKRRNGHYRLRWKVKGLPGTVSQYHDGGRFVTTEVNNVQIIYWLDFDQEFERPAYEWRIAGGRPSPSGRKSRCKPLKGEIERYIKR